MANMLHCYRTKMLRTMTVKNDRKKSWEISQSERMVIMEVEGNVGCLGWRYL